MSDTAGFLDKWLFRIVAVAYLAVGAVGTTFVNPETHVGSAVIVGGLGLIIGGLMLLSLAIAPLATQSRLARAYALFAVIGLVVLFLVILVVNGVFGIYWDEYWGAYYPDATGILVANAAITLLPLTLILWPCICLTARSQTKKKIIGLAMSRHEISMKEIAEETGIPSQAAKDVVIDAIAAGRLSGNIRGDKFVRATGAAAAAGSAVVLVVCPYCGAKTEQGLTHCQNCGAKL